MTTAEFMLKYRPANPENFDFDVLGYYENIDFDKALQNFLNAKCREQRKNCATVYRQYRSISAIESAEQPKID